MEDSANPVTGLDLAILSQILKNVANGATLPAEAGPIAGFYRMNDKKRNGVWIIAPANTEALDTQLIDLKSGEPKPGSMGALINETNEANRHAGHKLTRIQLLTADAVLKILLSDQPRWKTTLVKFLLRTDPPLKALKNTFDDHILWTHEASTNRDCQAPTVRPLVMRTEREFRHMPFSGRLAHFVPNL